MQNHNKKKILIYVISFSFFLLYPSLMHDDLQNYENTTNMENSLNLPSYSGLSFLEQSSFLGGNESERPYSMAIDSEGSIYITGYTKSPDFPTTSGAFNENFNGEEDIFVVKFNPDENTIIYSTLIGGNSNDKANSITVDAESCAYITGRTQSADFPITNGSYNASISSSIFVLKLSADGSSLIYSASLGDGNGESITIDDLGYAYITGNTDGITFNTTEGAYDETYYSQTDAFVVKLNPDGSTLIFSTFLGGSDPDAGLSIKLDSKNDIFISGFTLSDDFPITLKNITDISENGIFYSFICKLSNNGSNLLYSSYISKGIAHSIKLDSFDNLYIAGVTGSSNHPTTPGAFDVNFNATTKGFLIKISTESFNLIYSTFIGGNLYCTVWDFVLDSNEIAYLTGSVYSNDFPVSANSHNKNFSGVADAFFFKLSADGSINLYSAYLGGNLTDGGNSIIIDGNQNPWIAGYSQSTDFPVSRALFNDSFAGGLEDIFVSKILVDTLPEADFSTTDRTIHLSDNTVQFQFTGNEGNKPADFQWNFGDGSQNSSSRNPIHEYSEFGNYTVKLTLNDSNGDITTIAKENYISFINLLPTADFTSNATEIYEGDWVQFNDNSAPGDSPLTYQWNFGDDLDNSSDQNPLRQFSSSGNSTIILTVTDLNGDSHSTNKIITVLSIPIKPQTIPGFKPILTVIIISFSITILMMKIKNRVKTTP